MQGDKLAVVIDQYNQAWLHKNYIRHCSNYFLTDEVKGKYTLMTNLPSVRSFMIDTEYFRDSYRPHYDIHFITINDRWIRIRSEQSTVRVIADGIRHLEGNGTIRSILALKVNRDLYWYNKVEFNNYIMMSDVIECKVYAGRYTMIILADGRVMMSKDVFLDSKNWVRATYNIDEPFLQPGPLKASYYLDRHRIMGSNRIITDSGQVYQIKWGGRKEQPNCSLVNVPPCIDYITYSHNYELYIDNNGKLWTRDNKGRRRIHDPLLENVRLSYFIKADMNTIIMIDRDGDSYLYYRDYWGQYDVKRSSLPSIQDCYICPYPPPKKNARTNIAATEDNENEIMIVDDKKRLAMIIILIALYQVDNELGTLMI